jgi:dipeptidyl aminopeptidase/acylaminoacyl peptidase
MRSVIPAVVALMMVCASPVRAEVGEHTVRVGGRTVHYKVVLPDGYAPATEYPGVLVFGGGPQTMNVVDNVLNRNFRAEAEKRGTS